MSTILSPTLKDIKMTTNPTMNASITETLSRLSSKPGVRGSMVIDRSTSTVLQTSGSFPGANPSDAVRRSSSTSVASSLPADNKSLEEGITGLAAKIWAYVDSTAGLISSMDAEDNLKLLRLRTKKYELVIVPDAKFIFVVAHEVPS